MWMQQNLQSIPSDVTHLFVCGWAEELVFTRPQLRTLIASVDRVALSTFYLSETVRGDAMMLAKSDVASDILFDPSLPNDICCCCCSSSSSGVVEQPMMKLQLRSGSQSTSCADGTGLCLQPLPGHTVMDLLNALVDSPRKQFVTFRIPVSVSGGEELADKKHNGWKVASLQTFFPSFAAPTSVATASNFIRTVVQSGRWHDRALPPPLIRGIAPEDLTHKVQHFFGYGTLRSDDTSGASWTIPFNEGLTSELALLEEMALFLHHFPVVYVPSVKMSAVENKGVIGRLVWDAATVQAATSKHPSQQPHAPSRKTEKAIETPPLDWQTWSSGWSEHFANKVTLADRIEGCPKNYLRGVVRVTKRSTQQDDVLAFLYYKDSRCEGPDCTEEQWRKRWIASGNFLRRGVAFEGLPSLS